MTARNKKHGSSATPVALDRSHKAALALAVSLGLASDGASADPTRVAKRRGAAFYAPPQRELLFVDARVAEHDALEAATRAGIRTIVLDPRLDGIAQIGAALADAGDVAAVHLLGHGSAGAIELGATRLDVLTMQAYRDDLVAWFARRNAASARPEILVYGCETGAGDRGAAFVAALAQATGADVAASVDLTGGLALAADWDLEVASGTIETALPFERAAADAYPATLATFTVTTLADSGAGSLRDAVDQANSAAGTDTVLFQSGLTGTITLTTGALYVNPTQDLTITGPGAAALAVSGNDASRIFENPTKDPPVYDRGIVVGGGTFAITGLTLRDGLGEGAPQQPGLKGKGPGGCGGAMYINGMDATLTNVTLTGNNAGSGGAICFVGYDNTLTITGSTLSGNAAYSSGGAIYFDGDYVDVVATNTTFSTNTAGADGGAIATEDAGMLTLTNSTFTGNTAGDDGGALFADDLYGGGISITGSTFSGNSADYGGAMSFYLDRDSMPLAVDDTVITGNTATYRGGGINIYEEAAGAVTITNSEISNNVSGDYGGGGAFFYNVYEPLRVENTTISGNSSTGPGGGANLYSVYDTTTATFNSATIVSNSASGGGGLYVYDAVVTLQNSVVANNTPNDLAGDGTVVATESLIEAPGTTTVDSTGGGVITGQDPVLGALANNGGSTRTHLPLAGSPLIDNGGNVFATMPFDQRGTPFTRIVNGVVDIGALEVGGGAPIVFQQAVPTLGDYGRFGLALLLGGAGLMLLRRRRSGAPIVLAVALAFGGAVTVTEVGAAEPQGKAVARAKARAGRLSVRATTVATITRAGDMVTVTLGDNATYTVPARKFRMGDERKKFDRAQGHRVRRVDDFVDVRARGMKAGDNVVVKIRYAQDGSIKRLRLVLVDDAAAATRKVATKKRARQ